MREGKLHYGWIVIFMGLLTTIAAHGFGRMAYTIILPAMKDGLKFDYEQLGLLASGNLAGYLIMALIGGVLAARFGTRIVITLALILLGLTLILTGLAQSFGYALTMRFLTGVGNAASYIPAMALGSAWFAMKRRGFATGIVSGGIGAGTLISGLLVPPIVSAYGLEGWRFAWYTLGGDEMDDQAWNEPTCRSLGVFLSGPDVGEMDEDGSPREGNTLFLLFHAGEDAVVFRLPEHRPGEKWVRLLDTADARCDQPIPLGDNTYRVSPRSVVVFRPSGDSN